MAFVQEASASRAPVVRLADRYAVPFTALAFLLAGTAWYISGDAGRFAEVLVVATPRPLLLAAPVAFLGGMSRAARAGIIVKNGGTLERLARVRTAVFDKTGTLTQGCPALREIRISKDASRCAAGLTPALKPRTCHGGSSASVSGLSALSSAVCSFNAGWRNCWPERTEGSPFLARETETVMRAWWVDTPVLSHRDHCGGVTGPILHPGQGKS